MTKKRKRPDLSGCQRCGGKFHKVGGFMTCVKCEYRPEAEGTMMPSYADRLGVPKDDPSAVEIAYKRFPSGTRSQPLSGKGRR